jgi:hypothetical protein
MGGQSPAPPNAPAAHRGLPECVPRLFDYRLYQPVRAGGFRAVFHDDGLRGLYRGTSLARFGVSNGAPQFMRYEKMKGWAFERKRRRH